MAAILAATVFVLEEVGVAAALEAVLVVISTPPAVANVAGATGAALLEGDEDATSAVAVAGVDAVVVPRLGTDAAAPVEPVLM